MQTLTTNEALEYIRQQTGRNRKPHKTQLNRWQRYGWLARHTIGTDGKQNTYTIVALDELIDKIKVNYRSKRKP